MISRPRGDTASDERDPLAHRSSQDRARPHQRVFLIESLERDKRGDDFILEIG